MARGYRQDQIQQKLIEILSESKTGLSGVEIADKLGMNRATITKYLQVFAAEGIIKQKNIGNANLWFVESGTEKLEFPQDYLRVKDRFVEFLTSGMQQHAYHLIRNAQYSGADTTKILIEVIIPAIEQVDEMYVKAKIGKSEAKLFYNVISGSIRMLFLGHQNTESKKNVTVLSADGASLLYCKAASCALASHGWNVFELGDMSDSIDVMYDIDLQKFLTRIWKQKQGIMVILVFSASEEGAKFFSESAMSIKPKFGKNLHVAVYSRASKKPATKAEFVTDSFDAIVQWTDSVAGTLS
ncbi:MAG: winged helix-turn-helix transcriptional regulator [Candidatus Nitrosotenuis sp.]